MNQLVIYWSLHVVHTMADMKIWLPQQCYDIIREFKQCSFSERMRPDTVSQVSKIVLKHVSLLFTTGVNSFLLQPFPCS